MYKAICIFLFFIFLNTIISAQTINVTDVKVLHKKEDSLKSLSLKIIQGRTSADRFLADSEFTKIFVRALKIKN
jgi:hypothetical protein